jgi:hypothetical protein
VGFQRLEVIHIIPAKLPLNSGQITGNEMICQLWNSTLTKKRQWKNYGAARVVMPSIE